MPLQNKELLESRGQCLLLSWLRLTPEPEEPEDLQADQPSSKNAELNDLSVGSSGSATTMASVADLKSRFEESPSADRVQPTSAYFDSPMSMRQLHEANMRKRRLSIVATLSPADLRAWQNEEASSRAAPR